jgi:hypothetical protein
MPLSVHCPRMSASKSEHCFFCAIPVGLHSAGPDFYIPEETIESYHQPHTYLDRTLRALAVGIVEKGVDPSRLEAPLSNILSQAITTTRTSRDGKPEWLGGDYGSWDGNVGAGCGVVAIGHFQHGGKLIRPCALNNYTPIPDGTDAKLRRVAGAHGNAGEYRVVISFDQDAGERLAVYARSNCSTQDWTQGSANILMHARCYAYLEATIVSRQISPPIPAHMPFHAELYEIVNTRSISRRACSLPCPRHAMLT